MGSSVTISKKIGEITVVVHSESNISVEQAAKDAVNAIEAIEIK